MRPVSLSPSSLKEGRSYEYLVRFALGGTATVFTGFISSRYGASVGGLFLALPAIFCASATLIEKHEIRRKREAGLDGRRRGEEAVALECAGTVLGAVGMLAFALTFSLAVQESVPIAFISASVAWAVVSIAGWCIRRKMRTVQRTRRSQQSLSPDPAQRTALRARSNESSEANRS
jgi:uncharacterized membrane protein YjfL (UPF0719 family)